MSRPTNRGLKIAAAGFLILLPVISYAAYAVFSQRPVHVRIGAGREGGQYYLIAQALQARIERDYPHVRCDLISTEGALENLFLLEAKQIDLALYQPGALEALYRHDRDSLLRLAKTVNARVEANQRETPPEYEELCSRLSDLSAHRAPPLENVRFLANLYRQPAHLVVRPGLKTGGNDLRQSLAGKTIAVGVRPSGDYAMSLVLLDQLGLRPPEVAIYTFDPETLGEQTYYEAVVEELSRDDAATTFDAAFVTVGERAEIFSKLASDCRYDILGLPNIEALVSNHFYLTPYTIPAGMYGSAPNQRPTVPAHTVASGAQLIARADADPRVVENLTRIVLDKHFAKKNQLRELFAVGREFAQSRPEFAVHPAAQSVYDPEFDIHLVESVEAVYSLAASLVIVSFFALRWFNKRRERAHEHKLDRYVRSLLEIERRQVPLDTGADVDHHQQLQLLLDEVTLLRQRALSEFTAHELSEDGGSDCFINMCHALSSKINAKLSRQRLDMAISDLTVAIRDASKIGAQRTASDFGSSAT